VRKEDKFNVSDTLIVFGTNIRKVREMRNLTISELADRAKYYRGCLSSVEYGEQNLRYEKAVGLARALDVSFPALFSRNFINDVANENCNFSGSFQEDKFLLIFVENYKRELMDKNLKQINVHNATGQDRVVINRILKQKNGNPTIRTLAALASVTGSELYSLFSRNT
jgi:transcriptional regulator with XRE-family HTH domain